MIHHHKEKVESLLTKLAGEFLSQEAGPNSLITVTRVIFNEKAKRALIYITALPEDQEQSAVSFAKRKSSEFREYVKKHSKIGFLPIFDFLIDTGEKNRQLIDEIAVKENIETDLH